MINNSSNKIIGYANIQSFVFLSSPNIDVIVIHRPLKLNRNLYSIFFRSLFTKCMDSTIGIGIVVLVIVRDRITDDFRFLCRHRIIKINQRIAIHLTSKNWGTIFNLFWIEYYSLSTKVSLGTKIKTS